MLSFERGNFYQVAPSSGNLFSNLIYHSIAGSKQLGLERVSASVTHHGTRASRKEEDLGSYEQLCVRPFPLDLLNSR